MFINYKMIKIDKQKIESIDFDGKYKFSIPDEFKDDKEEFFGQVSSQHYRLLSYLSTLYNNANILDIGSHRGNSALALSYNETNTIYSFDIVDKIRPHNKNISNVKYVLEDLFNKEVQEKWNNVVLSCPFIFLDVDPHNGFMEIDFYNYLKDIGYKGFVVCDDVFYFKEMRDNFWYKINYDERYDLTEYGHWSGTGVISFDPNICFEKRDNSNWTLVTAYFNLTKCPDASVEINKRDQTYYLNHSLSTLSLPYNLIIYCDEESYELIKEKRPKYLESKTKYIIWEFDKIKFKKNNNYLDEDFAFYRDKIIQNRIKNSYYFDNRNTASYYLFCMSRYSMLKDAIEKDYFNSTHFCWINFCIERMGYKNLIYLDEALSCNRDKFSTCYIDYIPYSLILDLKEYYKWGRCSMCSGFFTGNKEYMFKVCDLIEDKFLEFLEKGYGHADEQLYSPVYFENIDLFEHYYGDYNQMITNYKYTYESPETPINHFIRNSFVNNNYLKCLEACEFLLNSINKGKCKLDKNYLTQLYTYYAQCKTELQVSI